MSADAAGPEPGPLQPAPPEALHREAGGQLVPFAGWKLPLHYGSQLDEHHATRRQAGVFDVSHMLRLDVEGPGAEPFLRRVLAADVARLAPGQGVYGCLLSEDAGILDDLMAYRLAAARYRLILNAAPRAVTLPWLQARASDFAVRLRARDELAMLAVQGPAARAAVHRALGSALPRGAPELPRLGAAQEGDVWLARSGYTGEDGYELTLPPEPAGKLWQALRNSAEVYPAGLGARDTLRLEAGLNLYGQDMDASTTPDECALGWTVHLDDPQRLFIGREALLARRAAGPGARRCGVVLSARGVLRSGLSLTSDGVAVGVLTSGGFAPTLGRGLGLARVTGPQEGPCIIAQRGRELPALRVRPPFVRAGQPAHVYPPLIDLPR